VLVCGGAGFIGSCFALMLRETGRTRTIAALAAEHETAAQAPETCVVNLDKLTYAGSLDNLAPLEGDPGHLFVRGDIGDRALVSRLLREHRPRAVVNFAAESHVDRSIDGAAAFIETNVVGTFELLEAVRAHHAALPEAEADQFRYVHVSTDEVYGSLGPTGTFTEESRHAPNSPYAASKAASDHFVRAYHHTYGLPTITTNCSNNYGPRQFPEKLVPLMILNALEHRALPVYGDGQNVRSWLHVADHCKALLLALARGIPGETYNIGGAGEMKNLDLVHLLCDLLDELKPWSRGSYRELITFVADRPGHDRRYAVDSSKAQRELGWAPEHTLSDGLRQTVRWYSDHRSWCGRMGERLGLMRVAQASA
jgi:dTDP-glucose 4,6-dehydratase